MKYIPLTYLLLITYITSFGQDEGNQAFKCWVDTSYLNCLHQNLPCQCHHWNHMSFIEYDLADTSFFGVYKIVNYSKADSISFDVMNQMKFLSDKGDCIESHISILKDTMYYLDRKSNKRYTYIPIKTWINFTDSVSLQTINSLMLKNGYPRINEVLNSDTLFCDCDIQFSINSLYNNKDVWALELKDNTLFIYEWTYPENLESKAEKNLFRKYKFE